MKALFLLPLLAACAAPVCKQAAQLPQQQPQIEVVTRVVIIHERPVHAALLHDYAQALRSEQPVVLHAKAPVINQLIHLDGAAKSAFVPLEKPSHIATQAEIDKAVAALGAVQSYIQAKH